MKKYIILMSILCTLSEIALKAMQSRNMIAAQQVPSFSSSAINEIPQFVYENCNQAVRHTWTLEEFKERKEKAETITQQQVRSQTKDQQAYTVACEEWDWIYGLNLIEKNYLSRPSMRLTVEDIKKINGFLSRLLVNNEGKFRDRDIVWPKRNMTDTESFFYDFFNNHGDSIGTDDCIIQYFNNQKGTVVTTLSVLLFMQYYMHHPEYIQQIGDSPLILNPTEVIGWEKEQSEIPGYMKGTINLEHWFNTRYHQFPHPKDIAQSVSMWASQVGLPGIHPIDLAARIWYKIVEIHPWHEANKRTGKALATYILLKNGYLPPLTVGEDGKRVVKTLQEGFEQDGGYKPFVDLIAELIVKTQAYVKGESLPSAVSSLMLENKRCGFCSLRSENLQRCGRCKKVYYCSKEHQAKAWSEHKKACQQI